MLGRESEEASLAKPRAYLKQGHPGCLEGSIWEFGLYLADCGEPLWMMEQGSDLSLLLSPFCFCCLILSGLFSFSTSPRQ